MKYNALVKLRRGPAIAIAPYYPFGWYRILGGSHRGRWWNPPWVCGSIKHFSRAQRPSGISESDTLFIGQLSFCQSVLSLVKVCFTVNPGLWHLEFSHFTLSQKKVLNGYFNTIVKSYIRKFIDETLVIRWAGKNRRHCHIIFIVLL